MPFWYQSRPRDGGGAADGGHHTLAAGTAPDLLDLQPQAHHVHRHAKQSNSSGQSAQPAPIGGLTVVIYNFNVSLLAVHWP